MAPLLCGCSLAGTWRTVAVTPGDVRFPISHVTFDDDGRYTATVEYDEGPRTDTGAYQWNGWRLVITPTKGPGRVYRGSRHWGGKLVLTDKTAEPAVKATLKQVGD
jgi:hypothetical protein